MKEGYFVKNIKIEEQIATQDSNAVVHNPVKEFVKSYIYIPIVAIICYILFGVVFMIAIVPSASMVPTLRVKSISIAWRLVNPEHLKRGDIVVFYDPDVYNERMVKRIIGLPGDTIEIKDGEVFVNGEHLDEDSYLSSDIYTDTGTSDTYVVPEKCLFLMGDNRGNSYDSRYWDNPYVDFSCVEGRTIINNIFGTK